MSQPTYFTPWRVGLFGVVLAIGIVLALTPLQPREQFPAVGAVSDRDVVASEDVTFISPELTTEAQEAARAEVETRFEFNPDIRPAQLEALRLYLDAVVMERQARHSRQLPQRRRPPHSPPSRIKGTRRRRLNRPPMQPQPVPRQSPVRGWRSVTRPS